MSRAGQRGKGWGACAILALVGALLALPASAGATSWSQIASGTGNTITAIEYQGPTRFWFTTASGEIYGRNGSGNFVLERPFAGLALNDIEFRPAPSEIGLAVGNGGQVVRTTNGGTSWEPIAIGANVSKATPLDCTATQALGDVFSVRFASATTAYILGTGSQMARSIGTASTVGSTGTWLDANWEDKAPAGRSPSDLCKLPVSATNLGDAFFVNENVGFFCTQIFGAVFATVNGLSTSGVEKEGGCGNGFTGSRHLAGDPANPNRMWAVGGNSKLDGTAMTVDAWANAKQFVIGNEAAREFSEPTDVAYAGGTVLSAGTAGMIVGSNDGTNFYFNDATGTLAATNWEAVALANGNDGAVGGPGGALAVTTDAANVVPPSTAPPGTTTPTKDTKAPETTITKKPKKKSAKRKAKFKFTSSEAGSTFECKFDKAKKYSSCKSPLTKKVKPGKHKLSVRAVDAAGNSDATPATWKFKVTKPKK